MLDGEFSPIHENYENYGDHGHIRGHEHQNYGNANFEHQHGQGNQNGDGFDYGY